MIHYVYKITFPGMPWFYYGVHTDNGRPYFGSPKTHRWIWDFYEYEKEILQFFDSREQADLIEKRIIQYFLNDKNCLNECAGGRFSLESLRRGAINKNKLPIKESTRQKLSEASKRKWKDPEISKKMLNGALKALNNSRTTEAKLRKSNSAKLTFKKVGHQVGEKNSQFGTIWVTDGRKNLKIKRTDSMPDGYYPGRILKSRV